MYFLVKIVARSNELEKLRVKAENLNVKLRHHELQLLSIRSQIANISFQKIKFHEILEAIRESITYMSKLKESWSNIKKFFEKFSLLTNDTIASEISKMVEWV